MPKPAYKPATSLQPDGLVYTGLAYRQSRDASAPWVVTFVCAAEELLSWAGIPQRTDQTVIGFQRPEDDSRVERAKKFFELGTNQSPTAIVVGIHPPSSQDRRTIRLEFNPEDDGKAIRRCELHVNWDGSLEHDVDVQSA